MVLMDRLREERMAQMYQGLDGFKWLLGSSADDSF